jgi:hypothetical protein
VNAREGLTRLVAVFALLCVVIAAMFGLGRLLGPSYETVTARTLSRSVTRETGGGTLDKRPSPCRRANGEWSCEVEDTSGSGAPALYHVKLNDKYCWEADKTRPENGGKKLPTHADGCVTSDDKGPRHT